MTTAPVAAEHAAQEGPLRRAISRSQQESSLPFVIVASLLVGGAALWLINRLVLGRTEQIDPGKLPA